MTIFDMKRKLKIPAYVLLLTFPILASSLSLGRIVTKSMHGEPLDADILIEDVLPSFKPNQLKAKLAEKKEFEEVGLTVENYHKDLKFNVYRDESANWHVRVTSTAPISTQFVNFLVSIDYPNGHLVREYMVILKSSVVEKTEATKNENTASAPAANMNEAFQLVTTQDNKKIVRLATSPDTAKDKPIVTSDNGDTLAGQATKDAASAPIVKYKSEESETEKPVVKQATTKQPVVKPVAKTVEKTESVKTESVIPATKPTTVVAATNKPNNSFSYKAGVTNQIITKDGDTLWKIAMSYGATDLNVHKMIYAMYQNNPKVFVNNNINKLMSNMKLKVPSSEEVVAVDIDKAIALIKNPTQVSNNIIPIANNTQVKAKQIAKTDIKPNQAAVEAQIPAPAEALVAAQAPIAVPATVKSNDTILTMSELDAVSNKSKVEQAKKPAIPVNNAKKITEAKVPASETADNLLSLTTIQQDLDNKKAAMQELRAKPTLKIVAASNNNSTASDLLLAAEKLVAKQRENQNLKEQILILQAQLKDMQSVVALKNNKTTPPINDIQPNQIASAAQTTQNTATDASNPLLPFDLPELNNKPQAQLPIQQDTIAQTKLESPVTNTDRVVNAPANNHGFITAAKNTVTSAIGAVSSSMSRIANKVVNYEAKFMLWVWVISIFGGISLILTYFYWHRNYRMQPATPDMMSGHDPIIVESERAVIDDLAVSGLDDFVVDDIIVKSGNRVIDNEIDANFDLVRAYMDLNDFVTAKKILDEILQNGDKQQQKEASKLLEAIPA